MKVTEINLKDAYIVTTPILSKKDKLGKSYGECDKYE